MTMNPDVIQAEVIACITDSLALDAGAVQPSSRMIDDLGADSLDFVDILFGLEKRLGLKLRSASVDAFLRAEFSEADLVDGRYVPRAQIDALAQWLPAMAQHGDLAHITPSQVYSFITVETFVRIAQATGKA